MTYNKEYYLKNREKHLEKSRKWRKDNPERIKQILAKSRRKDPVRKLLNNARARAKTKGIDFNLIYEDIKIPELCPLLKVKLSVDGPADYSPSLDRIDNTKGYIKENVWIISFKANRMKNTASTEELLQFAKSILKLHNEYTTFEDIIQYD